MSQPDSVPVRIALHKFESSLETLLASACHGGVAFDRTWTVRHDDDDYPDLMVEVTRLADRSETASCNEPTAAMDELEFESELADALYRAHRAGVSFDRTWTVRYVDGPDLMVEVTRLAKLKNARFR